MQLRHLTLERPGHDPFAQPFEAIHFRLHQTASVATAPLLPDASAQPLAGPQRFVARGRPRLVRFPRPCILARWNDGLCAALGNGCMACLGVVSAVATHAANRFVRRYLAQQLRQHGRITHAVVGHLNGPNLQRLGVNAQTHLAPLTPIVSSMLLAFPFAFAQELDAGAGHQQVQRRGVGSVGQLDTEVFLAPAHGAEVWHLPIQAGQTQQAFYQPQALAQGQAKQAFDAQAELDGGIGKRGLASTLAGRRGIPLHPLSSQTVNEPLPLSEAL